MKNKRHDIIVTLIREKKIRTHEQLVEELSACGIDVTQATVSRDIKDLGIVKVTDEKGAYYATASDWDNPLGKFTLDIINITHAMNLVIIHTTPGVASAVAAAVDKAMENDILGSIAGDDTIFIAVSNEETAVKVENSLMQIFMK